MLRLNLFSHVNYVHISVYLHVSILFFNRISKKIGECRWYLYIKKQRYT